MTRKTLLLGSTGFLGRELLAAFAHAPHVLAPTRDELDVTDSAALREYILAEQPSTIINAVGACGVSKCESNPELAQQLNSGYVQVLADAARMVAGCTLVHFSTLEVYGDVKPQHGQAYYNEDCPTSPHSIYAKTKLQGDLAIASTAPHYLIFRLSSLYDAYRLFAVEERDPISLGAPTAVQYVANTVVRGLARIERRVLKVHSGVYHLSAKGDSDWQTFYREVSLQRQKSRILGTPESPALVTTGPKLSVEKIENAFCLFIPSWQSQLKTHLTQSDLAANGD
ncbi:MAG: NAD(P)-dependent oxidoreductase [Idiomarina sp.]|nr:NAD(P)-dependent oxidoreductase [Idiomarina sp.]